MSTFYDRQEDWEQAYKKLAKDPNLPMALETMPPRMVDLYLGRARPEPDESYRFDVLQAMRQRIPRPEEDDFEHRLPEQKIMFTDPQVAIERIKAREKPKWATVRHEEFKPPKRQHVPMPDFPVYTPEDWMFTPGSVSDIDDLRYQRLGLDIPYVQPSYPWFGDRRVGPEGIIPEYDPRWDRLFPWEARIRDPVAPFSDIPFPTRPAPTLLGTRPSSVTSEMLDLMERGGVPPTPYQPLEIDRRPLSGTSLMTDGSGISLMESDRLSQGEGEPIGSDDNVSVRIPSPKAPPPKGWNLPTIFPRRKPKQPGKRRKRKVDVEDDTEVGFELPPIRPPSLEKSFEPFEIEKPPPSPGQECPWWNPWCNKKKKRPKSNESWRDLGPIIPSDDSGDSDWSADIIFPQDLERETSRLRHSYESSSSDDRPPNRRRSRKRSSPASHLRNARKMFQEQQQHKKEFKEKQKARRRSMAKTRRRRTRGISRRRINVNDLPEAPTGPIEEEQDLTEGHPERFQGLIDLRRLIDEKEQQGLLDELDEEETPPPRRSRGRSRERRRRFLSRSPEEKERRRRRKSQKKRKKRERQVSRMKIEHADDIAHREEQEARKRAAKRGEFTPGEIEEFGLEGIVDPRMSGVFRRIEEGDEEVDEEDMAALERAYVPGRVGRMLGRKARMSDRLSPEDQAEYDRMMAEIDDEYAGIDQEGLDLLRELDDSVPDAPRSPLVQHEQQFLLPGSDSEGDDPFLIQEQIDRRLGLTGPSAPLSAEEEAEFEAQLAQWTKEDKGNKPRECVGTDGPCSIMYGKRRSYKKKRRRRSRKTRFGDPPRF